ncbi:MAG TPA: hypothetical protein VEC59_11300 [Steroidobacteraceae bacterium]|nr:hypothetical protein [Steroidobacteraceae bacterium]
MGDCKKRAIAVSVSAAIGSAPILATALDHCIALGAVECAARAPHEPDSGEGSPRDRHDIHWHVAPTATGPANLIVEFAPQITRSDGYTFVRGAFIVKNYGRTVATNVRAQVSHAWGRVPPNYPKLDSAPYSGTGTSIEPEGRREEPIGWQIPDEQLTTGYFSAMYWAAYKNILEESKILQACYVYDASQNRFLAYTP